MHTDQGGFPPDYWFAVKQIGKPLMDEWSQYLHRGAAHPQGFPGFLHSMWSTAEEKARQVKIVGIVGLTTGLVVGGGLLIYEAAAEKNLLPWLMDGGLAVCGALIVAGGIMIIVAGKRLGRLRRNLKRLNLQVALAGPTLSFEF